ncbi:MAG: hypothetical protein KA712_03675 [Myxococcales bacterium]|nr:hypothetical protein [Myxococcales bacterium]
MQRPFRLSLFFLVGALAAGFGPATHASEQPALASGDLASKWKVNDDNPKANIPSVAERNADPLEFAYFLQDMAARAEGAFKASDWSGAVKYYEALATAVPEAWVSFSRLCLAYAKLGNFDIAAGNCGKAVSLTGAKVMDHLRFVEYTLKAKRFGPRDINNIEASLAHLQEHLKANPQPSLEAFKAKLSGKTEPAPSPAPPAAQALAQAEPPRKRSREEIIEAVKALQLKKVREKLEGAASEPAPVMHLPTEVGFLECRFAVRLNDAARLGRCVAQLRSQGVPDPNLLPFDWALALAEKNQAGAEAIIGRMEALGLSAQMKASMRAELERAFPRFQAPKVFVALAALLGAVAALTIYLWARRRGARPAPAV